MVLTKTAKPSR